METILKYRNRIITQGDAEFIQHLIESHPELSRFALSKKLCEVWNWRQPNGQLKDMVCRGLMLALHRQGSITLPEPRFKHHCPNIHKAIPPTIEVDQSPIHLHLKNLYPLEVRLVRQTEDEPLFNSLIQNHHYLAYTRPVGENLKYMIFSEGRPIACFAWSSAVHHLGSRDRYIGWTPDVRTKNLHFIAYNTRYLILPWVKVPHLASHLLGVISRRISQDWENLYHHPLYFLETFVDPEKYKGTCYRAANWGRGIRNKTHRPTRSIKEVLGYPLHKYFRNKLLQSSVSS